MSCSVSPAPRTSSTTSPACYYTRPKATSCKCWKARAAVRHLYYHAILSDPRHCRVLGEGPWPTRSFATWTMGFRQAPLADLRTLLGDTTNDSLGLTPRPYPQPQLLGLVLRFVEQDLVPTWQEQP